MTAVSAVRLASRLTRAATGMERVAIGSISSAAKGG